MSDNIHQKEEAIQSKWLKMAQEHNDAESLCTDGLLFRGPISRAVFGRAQKATRRDYGQNLPGGCLSLPKTLMTMTVGISVRKQADTMRWPSATSVLYRSTRISGCGAI